MGSLFTILQQSWWAQVIMATAHPPVVHHIGTNTRDSFWSTNYHNANLGDRSLLPTADYIPGHYYSLVFFVTLPTYLVLPSLTWLQCICIWYDERDLVIRQKLHFMLYSPQPFSLDVQPDDGLLEAKTCSWLAVTIICYIYI